VIITPASVSQAYMVRGRFRMGVPPATIVPGLQALMMSGQACLSVPWVPGLAASHTNNF